MSRKKKTPRRKSAWVPLTNAEFKKAVHDHEIKSLARAVLDSGLLPPPEGPRLAVTYSRFSRGESLVSSKKKPPRRKADVAPTTNAMRDRVILDHLINLTDQVRRLARALRDAGIHVPPDVGTLGPASEDVVDFYTKESFRQHFPGQTPPWEEDHR